MPNELENKQELPVEGDKAKDTIEESNIKETANISDAKVKKPSMFAITKEIKSEGYSPIIPNENEPFPIVELTKVSVEEVTTKSGDKKRILNFVFVQKSTGRSHTHSEWGIDKYTDAEDLAKKVQGVLSRIKHIYEQYKEVDPVNGIEGTAEANDFDELFEVVAKAFNTGNEGTPIFTGIPVYIKLVINKKAVDKGFQLPLSTPFLERVRKNGSTIIPVMRLTINIKSETIIQKMSSFDDTSAPNAITGNINGAANDAFPKWTGN